MRIASMEVFTVTHPVCGFFRFFPKDASGRSIRPSVLVKIATDDGLSGWGETVPIPLWSYETTETVVTTIRQHFAPAIIGRDIFDLADIHQTMNRCIAPSFSTGQPFAKTAIDLALHDLVSKALKTPLPKLWGRNPQPTVTLSWTVNATTLEQAEQIVAEGKERGYRKGGCALRVRLAAWQHPRRCATVPRPPVARRIRPTVAVAAPSTVARHRLPSASAPPTSFA